MPASRACVARGGHLDPQNCVALGGQDWIHSISMAVMSSGTGGGWSCGTAPLQRTALWGSAWLGVVILRGQGGWQVGDRHLECICTCPADGNLRVVSNACVFSVFAGRVPAGPEPEGPPSPLHEQQDGRKVPGRQAGQFLPNNLL